MLFTIREFLNDKKVVVQLVCSFRYGKEVSHGEDSFTGVVDTFMTRMRRQWASTLRKS